jgi:hypothetical protein|tara:strand:+ start:360 stop:590 length:231 start_codon:yes stop_codon:yes gene_type:complete
MDDDYISSMADPPRDDPTDITTPWGLREYQRRMDEMHDYMDAGYDGDDDEESAWGRFFYNLAILIATAVVCAAVFD